MGLNVYKMVDEKYCTDCVCVIPSEVYLKSEADEVIAELERKVNLNKKSRQYWRKEWTLEYKENLHNKYKRCLAMARLCDAEGCWYENQEEDIKAHWFFEWEYKWLELAEKFKEVK